jgi:CRAL/TRIO domain
MGGPSIRNEASRRLQDSSQKEAESLHSGRAGLSPADEQNLRRVRALAGKENRTDVLESFRNEVILRTVQNHSLNAAKAWNCLKESLDSHQEVRELEHNMDHAAFYDCLSSGYFVLSGTDRRGRPILWMRAFQNQSLLKKGSPLACAYTRAIIYMVEVLCLKTFPGSCDTLVIVDDSRRKALDLNLPLWHEIFRLLAAIFPMGSEEVWICGISSAGRALLKAFNSLLNGSLHFMDSKEVAIQIALDPTEIPEWWILEPCRKVFEVSFNTHWEWERCLARGEKTISRKEILNPTGPWNSVGNDCLGILASKTSSLEISPSHGMPATISGIDGSKAFHFRSLPNHSEGIPLDTIDEESSDVAEVAPIVDT